MLAHAGAVDESLSVALLFAAVWVGWVGWSKRRGTGFDRLPARAGPALLVVAVALVVTAAVVPPALFPAAPGVASPEPGSRPSSPATIAFDEPAGGTTVTGDEVRVVLELRGARVIDGAATDLAPDTGHVHLSLDGRLVSMTFGLVQVVDLRSASPGPHTLEAEFVAADHAPFDPRVRTVIRFRTEDR